ncbi:caspase domain-containing protein [Pseudescherichia vulneris]
MKLAVLIGVSDYASQQNLSACRNDVKLMKSMLDLSSEYADILYIENETNTRQVKSKLSEFIEKHSKQEIDELLFYFSGHGLFDGSDFHYILSDFDTSKIKSTSLENSELDIMMKSLTPKLTVKIVDACNSGVSYIKDPAALSKHIDESKLGFSKCYFMFSSGDAQSSFADAHLSFFTKAIGEAVAYTAESSIRYKDIIDYISDKFSRNENQSPVFINQAAFTEVFIKNITRESKKIIEGSLSVVPDAIVEAKKQPLKDLVVKDADRYFSEEKALKIYESIPAMVSSQFKFKGDAKDLFDLTVVPSDTYDDIPKLPILAEWVAKNNDDLFITARSERKERQVRKPKRRTIASSLAMNVWGTDIDDDDNYKWVTEYFYSPVAIESSLNCTYKFISVLAKAKYPNVNSAKLFILPFLSKTKLVILSCVAPFRPSGWDDEVLIDSNIKWTPYVIELIASDGINDHISVLVKNFETEVITPVLKTFNLLPETKGK